MGSVSTRIPLGGNDFASITNVRPPWHLGSVRVETKGALLNDKHRAAIAAHQPTSHHP